MRWSCAGTKGRGVRSLLALFVATAAALAFAATAFATSLTPGDVVVERDGTGTEALPAGGAAVPVFLDEFEAGGAHVAELALPTSKSGSNFPLVDSGGASSDGLITLSGNQACVLMAGYDAPLGLEKVTESKAKEDPRVVAVINGKGEINTTTALENADNENNARSATSQECTKLWIGGNGTKTTGGVVYATVGAKKSEGVQLDESITNLRQVEVVDGQLYVSGNPEKAGHTTIAKVGSGLPTTSKQTITNLPFETSPEEPYAYSMLTLGPGAEPDTIYVAEDKENGRQAVVKYGLSAGKWVEHGSVEIPYVTGVTANDVNGLVTIYATSSGSNSKTGTLYRFQDYSGLNGTLSAVPAEIAKAPANEAWRGVAFAPGTTIGHGGTPPPEPEIVAHESALPAAIDDPTNPTLPIYVEDPHSVYTPGELTVSVDSSNESVAPLSGITVSGSGHERTLSVIPAGVGESKLTLTVEAPDGAFTTTQITYGASEYLGNSSDRYYTASAAASATISVGEGYMLAASDEENEIKLYHERISGPPVKSWNFNGELPFHSEEANIHGVTRAGNTLYWVGGMANANSGELEPSHNTMFATTITGSGASTELTYLGSFTALREELVEWDNANGAPLGLAASTESGVRGEGPEGFKIEGVEFAPGSSTEAYLTFRAPLEPPGEGAEDRDLALVIPVTNFSSLFTDGNPDTEVHASFGTPLEWHLGGLTVRTVRKNAAGEYVLVASTASSADTVFQIWGWDGETEDEPVLLNAEIPQEVEGVWDAITSTPEPIRDGDQVEVLQDDSKTVWYGKGTHDAEKGLITGLQKSLGRLLSVEIPAPGTPNPPHLSQGKTPNKGQFTLKWKPAPTLRAEFLLEHQNARQKEKGEWSTVGSWRRQREYAFGAGNPEEEGTWTYRVKERNETGEGPAPSEPSEPIKVDKTPPYTPTATPSREPDYSGKGGWYKNSVTVSFTANGDPVLSDGSPGSGVNPATLTAPETFETSGSHKACGTVADYAENVSEPGCVTVQVDATPPNLEISCPATALINEAGVTATVTASDAYSGLASDPSGIVPIDTSTPGPYTITRTAVSNVGLETTKSCTTEVVYPTPGAPALTAGTSPNNTGLFTLGWSGDNPLQYLDLSYTLQAHDAATSEWTTVASGIEALGYEFSGAGEEEGTWVFRVQGVDTTHGVTTEYSPVSAPVVVDETPPYTPLFKVSRPPDYAGNGGWYKDSVTVSFKADGDPPLKDGSPGSGVNPETLTAPETFDTSGQHIASGTDADYAGNVSQPATVVVQVEATPPGLEVECPAKVLVGEAGREVTIRASDIYSGLKTNPSGTVPIDTSTAGFQTFTRTAVSNVGLETTKSCTTEVGYPTPGAPTLIAGASPNDNGLFTLGWSGDDPLQYPFLSYTLQAHDAATSQWSTVASGIEALSYGFSGAGEKEGTWVYRVQGSDTTHGVTTEYSPVSAPVVVDETPPYAPSATASRQPDYAGGGGWYKDSVEVKFTSNGDPNLSDGSPGSGVNPASIPASRTFSTSGSHTACGTVADYAGNVSKEGCLTVQVDATPPSLEIECPAAVAEGTKGVYATVTASDDYSGLKTNPSGTVPIETSSAGPQTITRTAVSNVGLETTKSCTTEVGSPPEFGRCKEGVSHGEFITGSCSKKGKKDVGSYEWLSQALTARFRSTSDAKATLETASHKAVTCTEETSSGEYTGQKTVAGVVITLTGCELTATHEKCASGHTTGTIVTNPLEGVLGVYKESHKLSKEGIGLELYPAGHSGPVMDFSCASTTVSVRGSVILPVKANTMAPALELKAETKKGKQVPESFAKGPKEILEGSVGGGGFEATLLTLALPEENGEELEVNVVV